MSTLGQFSNVESGKIKSVKSKEEKQRTLLQKVSASHGKSTQLDAAKLQAASTYSVHRFALYVLIK